jgi:hypothetical protein
MNTFDEDRKERPGEPTGPAPDDRAEDVTVTVTGPSVTATVPGPPADADCVRLREAMVPIASDVGRKFTTDCVRNVEGTFSEAEIKTKWGLSDQDWLDLADNAPLLAAIRAERERRIFSGEGAREAAQRHYAKTPGVLNRILTDEQVPPRHRIEAARELRQAAASGPDIEPGPKEKFTITINLGADTEVYEKYIDPRGPKLPDDGEPQ